jgi:hypothetical protein
MFTIEKVEDFKLFIASEKARKHAEPKAVQTRESNRKFLTVNPPVSPQMPITGTFVYPHPPNYRGCPTHHYSVNDWTEKLQDLKTLGMDTIILQASVWNELEECYYPSTCFSKFKQWNVVEPMLEAAKITDMVVYLGGYGSVAGWKEHLTQGDIDKEKENHITCFHELLKYRELFDGIYFVPETAFAGTRDNEKEKFLNEIYRDYCTTIKREAPEKMILMSPATIYCPDKTSEMVDSWLTILADVPLDIMAPQDSIGTCENELKYQAETYKAWAEVCYKCGIKFWSNIEIFERKDLIVGVSHSIPASPERVSAQINHAAPYVEKLICWEAPYYLYSGREGQKLKELLTKISR